MTDLIFVLNGPNLNLLGTREPRIYGTQSLADIGESLEKRAKALKLRLDIRQSNHEGVLVDWIQEAFERDAAVVINPAGFSFDCIPVLDALKLIRRPLIEVHVTNIHQRSVHYQESYVSLVANGVICGLGPGGYLLALRAVAEALGLAAVDAEP